MTTREVDCAPCDGLGAQLVGGMRETCPPCDGTGLVPALREADRRAQARGTKYRLSERYARGRLYVSRFYEMVETRDHVFTWTSDVKAAHLFTREEALRFADDIDAAHAAYRAAHDNPEIRNAKVRPLAIVPTTGGVDVVRTKKGA